MADADVPAEPDFELVSVVLCNHCRAQHLIDWEPEDDEEAAGEVLTRLVECCGHAAVVSFAEGTLIDDDAPAAKTARHLRPVD